MVYGTRAAAGGLVILASRRAIRQRFEERFTARRMAREYLAVYRGLMDKRRPRRNAHRAGEFLAPSQRLTRVYF